MRLLVVTSVLIFSTAATAYAPPGKTAKTTVKSEIAEARRLLDKGETSKAEVLLRGTVQRYPSNAMAHNELGVTLFQQGAWSAAVPIFERAVKLQPQFAHAWANLGEARRRAKKHRKAAYAFHRFLKLRRSDPYALYGLGVSFEGYGSYGKSLRTLRIAKKYAVKEEKGRLLGRVNAALIRVTRKLAESKRPALVRGDALFRARQFQEALTAYKKGIKKKSPDGVLLGRVGLVHAVLGDLSTAQKVLEQGLWHAPTDPVARAAYILVRKAQKAATSKPIDTSRGPALLATDRAALAFKVYSLAAAQTPSNTKLQLGRGESALRMGNFTDAMSSFDMAASGGPNKAATAGRAEVYLLKGDQGQAKSTLSEGGLHINVSDLPVWRRSLLEN